MEQKKNLAASVFNLLGGLSGLISISLIIWQGGQLYQRVEDHGRRLDRVENDGSRGLGEHVKQDDERILDLRNRMADQASRITHVEDVNSKLLELAGDIKAMNVKLDMVKEQIRVAETKGKL